MCKVSVIIPVYNTEQYLVECLNSVCNQTLKDMEIICMDDGSSDGSSEILDEYSLRDDRIKVIHKANSGYGDSVNQGIEVAKGDYIGIVEPDDYIVKEMYEELVLLADKNDLDFAKGNFVHFVGDGCCRTYSAKKVIGENNLYNCIIRPIEYEDIFRGYIMNPSGIYRRKFLNVNGIRHNVTPGASYQDTGFWFQIMVLAKKAIFIDRDYYFYRQDNNASSMNNKNKIFCICEEYKLLFDKIKKNMIKDSLISEFFTLCMFVGYWNTIPRIAASSREAFIRRFSEDFIKLKKEEFYDVKKMNDYEKRVLINIVNEPDSFIQENLKNSEYYRKKLNSYEKVIIYGAGDYCKRILSNLYDEEYNKVVGLVVSDIEGQPRKKYQKNVDIIDKYIEYKDSIAVLIGVSDKFKEEVYDILKEKEFRNIIENIERI